MVSIAALLASGLPLFAGPIQLKTIDGISVHPLSDAAKMTVLIFVTEECPISRGYAPEIARVAKQFSSSKVRFFLVHEDADTTVSRAKAYGKSFGLNFPTLLDTKHQLAKKVGVTAVPTAAIYSPSGSPLYVGRIDNRYPTLGVRSRQVTSHDLQESLTSLLKGEKLKLARTQVTGCTLSLD